MVDFLKTVIEQVIRTLEKNDIDYLIIGGIAGIFYGLNRPTFDFDIIIRSTDVDDFICLFHKKGFKVIREIVDDRIIFFESPGEAIEMIDKEKPRAFKIAKFDLIGDIWFEPRIPFPRLEKNRVNYEMEGVSLKIVSKNDWIKLKELSGRDEDLKDIQIIRQVKNNNEK